MTRVTTASGVRTTLIAVALVAAAVLAPRAIAAGERCGDTDQCLRNMRDSIAKRGWLGIEYEEEGERGLPEILAVLDDSPAARGGMQAGDLLLTINGVSYAGPREDVYAEWKEALVPGNELRLVVDRGGEEVPLRITAGHVPDAVAAQWIGRHMLEYHLDDEDDSGYQESESEDRG